MTFVNQIGNQHQGILESTLAGIFPSQKVITEARREVAIKNPITGHPLEVDVWYPDINLCFEYQDAYHYKSTWFSHRPLQQVQESDYIKRILLLQQGQTLVDIPHWWDGTESSLKATIQFHRPDLVDDIQQLPDIIPCNPPFGFFSEDSQLMLASFPYSDTTKIVENQWWLGEKYDGVRCYWDPTKKELYSRSGLVIDVFPSTNHLFGNIALDGEIWCGRGLFLESLFLLQGSLDKAQWALFRVVCFDEASQSSRQYNFERRYSLILSHFHSEHPVVIIASRFLHTGNNSLTHILQQVVDSGGEGIILRKPLSVYHPNRSSDLLKLKASRGDHDALVVNVEDDGSLMLQLQDGTTLIVPKSRCLLHRKVMRGSVVSFTYNAAGLQPSNMEENDDFRQEISENFPPVNIGGKYHPIVFRIRDDVSWEDITRSSLVSVPDGVIQNIEQAHAKKPTKYWPNNNKKNLRIHLEHLAQLLGFDPLVADNWYNVSGKLIKKHKEGRAILRYYSNSLIRALVDLFPELQFDISKFVNVPNNYWKDSKNRRELLEKFARTKGHDPLDHHFWYSIRIRDLRKFDEAMVTIAQEYGGYTKLVMSAFPEIPFDWREFKCLADKNIQAYWQRNRRSMFCEIAHQQGFDPLVASNWYSRTADPLFHVKIAPLLKHYGGSLALALKDVFPEFLVDPTKFKPVPHGHWKDVHNRRSLFVEIAKQRGFDPLVASEWYPVTNHSLAHIRIALGVLRYYGGSLQKGLLDMFPDIGLEENKFTIHHIPWKNKHSIPSSIRQKSKLDISVNDVFPNLNFAQTPGTYKTVPGGHWKDINNRRAVLYEIAKRLGFDPLIASNWYNITYASLNIKILTSFVRAYHGNSLATALLELFPNIGLEESKLRRDAQTE